MLRLLGGINMALKYADILDNKKILVTGGTGSFGKYIIENLLKSDCAEIRVFSRDEKKQDDLRFKFKNNPKLRLVLGDVRDYKSVKNAMKDIDYVFHAAALKQVPSCEYNVFEAVKTNILGAQNIVNAALESNIKKVIAISTDKAVEAVNAMGMSKAIQEKIITSANLYRGKTKTIFCCVRYGNVLGSRGSVVPLFKKQIEKNEPLTLTDKRMTRFIFTLDEAMALVFKALELSVGGEIFIPKIPSHTVLVLAELMIDELDAKNKEIKIVGIRPGEKIHETLVSPTESLRTLENDDLYIILPQIKLEDIEKKYPNFMNNDVFRFSSEIAKKIDKDSLRELLKKEQWI